MKAIHNNVIYTLIEDEVKKSLIILQDEKPKKSKGLVKSVGEKCLVLEEGDIILAPRYGDEFEIEGVKYMVCKEEDIGARFQ